MFLSLISILIPASLGWGGDGHRIISDLALRLISDTSRNYLELHLKSLKSISRASVWADSDEAKSEYPGSEYFHFSNTPYRNCQPFRVDRDCTNGICIVTGLSESIVEAINIEASEKSRTDALKFVLHLVADIHQPLHTGFREDSGGGRIRLAKPQDATLHEIWDTKIVEEYWEFFFPTKSVSPNWKLVADRIGHDIDTGTRYEALNASTLFSSNNSLIEYVSDMVTSTVMETTCRFAYTNEFDQYIGVGDELGVEFFNSRFHVVHRQMAKAAIQLARLLDGMSSIFFDRRRDARRVRAEERASSRLFELRLLEANITTTQSSRMRRNQFELISIDFDFDELKDNVEYLGFVADKPAVARSKKGKVIELDDDELLDLAIAQNSVSSFVIDGIDYSKVVLVKRLRENHVTYRSIGPFETPKVTVTQVVKYMQSDGTLKRVIYHFDQRVFGNRDQLKYETVLRCALKFAGIDFRLDLGDVGERSIDVEVVALEKTTETEEYEIRRRKRYQTTQQRFAGQVYTIESQIGKFKRGEIIRITGDRLLVFVLRKTLETAGDLMSFNLLQIQLNPKDIQEKAVFLSDPIGAIRACLIDPEIFDGPLDDEHNLWLRMLERVSVDWERCDERTRHLRPTLFNELDDADRYSDAQIRRIFTASAATVEFVKKFVLDIWSFRHPSMTMFVLEWVRPTHRPADVAVDVVGRQKAPIVVALEAVHRYRYEALKKRIHETGEEYTFASQITKFNSAILQFQADFAVVFILNETLASAGEEITVNSFMISVPPRNLEEKTRVLKNPLALTRFCLIDANIFDGDYHPPDFGSKILPLLLKVSTKWPKADKRTKSLRPSIIAEIQGVDFYVEYQMKNSRGHKMEFKGPRTGAIKDIQAYHHPGGDMSSIIWERRSTSTTST